MQGSSALESTFSNTSGSSAGSIEIGDGFLFCEHGSELCKDCQADYREDNGFTAGVEMPEGLEREPIVVETTLNKDNEPQCKKVGLGHTSTRGDKSNELTRQQHKSTDCKNCFNFKKQIQKELIAAKKAAKGKKGETSNLFQ